MWLTVSVRRSAPGSPVMSHSSKDLGLAPVVVEDESLLPDSKPIEPFILWLSTALRGLPSDSPLMGLLALWRTFPFVISWHVSLALRAFASDSFFLFCARNASASALVRQPAALASWNLESKITWRNWNESYKQIEMPDKMSKRKVERTNNILNIIHEVTMGLFGYEHFWLNSKKICVDKMFWHAFAHSG